MQDLLEQERQARLSKDEPKMTAIISNLLSLCASPEETLAILKLLSKRKAQLKTPFKNALQETFQKFKTNINFLTNLLKEIIEGKFYLEDERIQITTHLKFLHESNNDFQSALSAIFIPVETFNIDEKRKTEYLLEILRLCIKNEDWVKSEIVSKRVRLSYFTEKNEKELEVKFYRCMIGISLGQKRFKDACYYFRKLYEIESCRRNAVMCSFFGILCGDMGVLRFCVECKDNSEEMRRVVRMFLVDVVIPVRLVEIVSTIATSSDNSIFSNDVNGDESGVNEVESVVGVHVFLGDFLSAVNGHNFRVISMFFERIRIADLMGIMQCEESECIKIVCDSVNKGMINARIDQSKSVVIFKRGEKNDSEERIERVLNRLVKINHLIMKENMEIGK